MLFNIDSSMKIIVASRGRSHLLDCARELHNKGYNVVFYCMTKPGNMRKYRYFGRKQNMIYIMFPLYFLARIWHGGIIQRICDTLLDFCVALIMPHCDVFIAQSPNYFHSMRKAKKRGAILILDRGSSHVRKFNALNLLYGTKLLNENYQQRDERMYQEADYIAVASTFVKNGFVEFGLHSERIFVNPYGVSLDYFHSTYCSNEYDAILVGQWSKRKGHELVVNAFKDTDYKILHVGSITDYPFPDYSNFTHIDSVPENKLINYYSKSRIFLFPSYEDGFGLVLLQAAACGLPIVCSSNCGGPTLKRMLTRKDYIYEMKELSKEELMIGFKKMYNIYQVNQLRNYAEEDIDKFSWKAYGERYANFLNTIRI